MVAFVLVLGVGPAISWAQPTNVPYIHLQYARFDPLRGDPDLHLSGISSPLPTGQSTYLLQFTGPVREAWKDAVEHAGVKLYGYIPDYAFISRMDFATRDEIVKFPFVRWIGPYQSAYRLAASLQEAGLDSDIGPISLDVVILPDADPDSMTAQIKALGGAVEFQVKTKLSGYLKVELPNSRLNALAAIDGVLWIEPSFQQELLNNVAGGITMRAESIRSSLGLYGKGQIVAIADSGLDVGSTGPSMSPDFLGRILAGQAICASLGLRSSWNDFLGHGTHVSGSVLGSGVLSGSNPSSHHYSNSFAGLAPEAQLVMQAIDDPITSSLECIPYDLLSGLFRPAYDTGARLHSNSWGGPTGISNPFGGYNTKAWQVDGAAWAYKDMLIFYAAGNGGIDANNDGIIDPDSIYSPGTAKNVVTVGASENNRPNVHTTWGDAWSLDFPVDPIHSDFLADNVDGIAAFSGRGPTDDGRIKPDVVAPGTMIISDRSHEPVAGVGWGEYNQDYAYDGGTSMATPLTSGAGALVREWITTVMGIIDPSAALMKAALINGAVDMSPGQYTNPQEIPSQVPNNVSGWGRVDLVESIAPAAPRQIWLQDTTSGIYTGEIISYRLSTGTINPQPQSSKYSTKLGSSLGTTGNSSFTPTSATPLESTPVIAFQQDDMLVPTTPPTLTPTTLPTSPPTATPSPVANPSETPTPLTSSGPFRITLVWTDYPGEPGAAKALVNDLDLEVIAPDGAHYFGNAGLLSSGQCLRDGKWDACNNVEGLVIPAAFNGTYIILVHGANIPKGPQPFALVASGDYLQTVVRPLEPNDLLIPLVVRHP